MDSKVAIKVENLSKEFHYFDKDYKIIKWAFTGKGSTKTFKVLNNLNFEVLKGDRVGILGRNGTGKSTLLKMISGVYTQTTGTIYTDGKISSMLELTSGFNRDISGRENIYYKGTLMDLDKSYIDSIIDDVIEFADIGEYIDMPLSTYSSGMSARLGFSLAVNVDPDILIIDEVFAVGDSDFKNKSKKKTESFFEKDKTILFVSHSEKLVREFCNKVIYLHNKKIKFYGDVEEGLAMYNKDDYNKKRKIILKQSACTTTSLDTTYEINFGYGLDDTIMSALPRDIDFALYFKSENDEFKELELDTLSNDIQIKKEAKDRIKITIKNSSSYYNDDLYFGVVFKKGKFLNNDIRLQLEKESICDE